MLGLQRAGAAQLVALFLFFGTVTTQRSEAFIGYNEEPISDGARVRCQNKEARCAEWQADGQCLENPYYMRFTCPQSCETPFCVGYSKQRPPWKGFATEYNTKQYATRSAPALLEATSGRS